MTRWIIPVLLVCLICVGCFSRPLAEAPCPGSVGLGAGLESIGSWFTKIGLVAAGLGAIAWVFTRSPICGYIFSAGLLSAIVGGIFVWLGANLWMVVVACIATGLAWAYYHRAPIRRWLDRIKTKISSRTP